MTDHSSHPFAAGLAFFNAALGAQQIFLECAMRGGAQTSRFTSERIDAHIRRLAAIGRCRDMREAALIEAEFLNAMTGDYADQTRRMLGLMSQAGREVSTALTPEVALEAPEAAPQRPTRTAPKREKAMAA